MKASKDIVKRLAYLRQTMEAASITAAELADHMHVTHGALSRMFSTLHGSEHLLALAERTTAELAAERAGIVSALLSESDTKTNSGSKAGIFMGAMYFAAMKKKQELEDGVSQ